MVLVGICALTLGAGCKPQRKVITDHDRRAAAHLVSEAQFALSVREWARAEGLLGQAVAIAPEGDTFLTLGAARLKLGNRAGAKDAYESAVRAYADQAALEPTQSGPWMKQAYALALLGRKDDCRALLARGAKQFPNDARLRALQDPRQFELMISTPSFRDMAL